MPNMRRLRIAALPLLLGCVAFVASGCSSAMSEPSSPITVHEADAGKTIHLVVAQELVVHLPYTAGTGYSWSASPAPSLLKLSGTSDVQRAQVPGSSGEQVLIFTAVAPGAETLTLVYARPWEKGKAPAKSFALMVTIAGS